MKVVKSVPGSGEVSNVGTGEVDTGQIGEVNDVGTGRDDTNGPHIGVEILGIDTTPPAQVTGLVAEDGRPSVDSKLGG